MPARMRNRSSKAMSRSRAMGMMGGASNGGGGAGWMLDNFGDGPTQFYNTFKNPNLGVNTGNLIPTVSGAPGVINGLSPQGINPPSQLIPLKMFGGKKRKSKSKRGGMGMLATAAVPLTLLALQQSYGTRRNRRSRRGRRGRRGSRRR